VTPHIHLQTIDLKYIKKLFEVRKDKIERGSLIVRQSCLLMDNSKIEAQGGASFAAPIKQTWQRNCSMCDEIG
jgi:hypothetical protein